MAEREPGPDPAPDSGPARDPAMGRYMALHLVRLACIFAVMFGLLIQENRIEGPALLGFALLVGGAAGFFFLPHTLAKRWKSREQ
jgi:hypothetical protein